MTFLFLKYCFLCFLICKAYLKIKFIINKTKIIFLPNLKFLIKICIFGRGWAAFTHGHQCSSLATWVMAGLNFKGWKGVVPLYPWPSGLVTRDFGTGRVHFWGLAGGGPSLPLTFRACDRSSHEGPVDVTHISLTPVDVTPDLYASCLSEARPLTHVGLEPSSRSTTLASCCGSVDKICDSTGIRDPGSIPCRLSAVAKFLPLHILV